MLRIIFLKNNMTIQILRVQIQSSYALIDHSVHNEGKKIPTTSVCCENGYKKQYYEISQVH